MPVVKSQRCPASTRGMPQIHVRLTRAGTDVDGDRAKGSCLPLGGPKQCGEWKLTRGKLRET